MRYPDVLAAFEAFVVARNACSREWKISEAVVMCLEFDIFAAARLSMLIPSHTEGRAGMGRMIKITYFDRNAMRVDAGQLTPPERVTAAARQEEVDLWMKGGTALPVSTSSVIADRLRGVR